MTEILLAPFNRTLNLREAYNWDQDQVYDFLERVVDNPATYGVPNNAMAADLPRIRKHLLRLSLPNGDHFRAGEELEPDQHIYRSRDLAWVSSQFFIPKFGVKRHFHNNRGYWSPYDLLGLFLSSMGPAPPCANKRNFFLPMTAVYGRWCRQIAGQYPGGGVGTLPAVFQCTWREKDGQPDRFFLGSSLAGYECSLWLTGRWERVLKHARFNLVDRPILRLAGYTFNQSPMRQADRKGDAGTRFGNCGETYPFINLLENHIPVQEPCHGLALNNAYVRKNDYDDTYSGVIWRNVWNPCDNCRELIRFFGGNVDNFGRENERADAPP